jgi:prepilin-type N-terminal cleavage/methylation domain-containing protein
MRGFSLIELTIVVALIVILSMIATPYLFTALAKGRRAEAYVLLRSLYLAEKSYWAERGAYTPDLSAAGLNWKPEGTPYYSYGFGEGVRGTVGASSGARAELRRGYADGKGFKAIAAADIRGNGKQDVLSIDHKGVVVIEQDGLA